MKRIRVVATRFRDFDNKPAVYQVIHEISF